MFVVHNFGGFSSFANSTIRTRMVMGQLEHKKNGLGKFLTVIFKMVQLLRR